MELAAQVGHRLRELRVARGWSLSELARRSRIGKGTLSSLESGRRNPTLETLYALTTALGVPLTEVLRRGLGPAELSGAAVDALLVERYEDADAVTELFRVRIRAGRVQESAAHARGTVEHVIVLSGTARIGEVGATRELGPGEHGQWPGDAPHEYAAPSGDVEAVLTVRYPIPGAVSGEAFRQRNVTNDTDYRWS